MPTLGDLRGGHDDRALPLQRGRPMSRRSLVLLVLSVGTLALSACSDTTAPTSRQIKPAGQASFDVTDPDVCKNGYMTSTGKAC
jgi:ABC-type oligopeptide transport system substrate-binding subunit